MSTTSDFVQIVTSGYALSKEMPKIDGTIGPTPVANTSSSGKIDRFAGKFIPSFAKELRFVFSQEEKTRKRDIYDYFDFWLISENQKLKFNYAAASSFEFLEANTFDSDGTKTSKKFWIAKVIRHVDCINAQKSTMCAAFNRDATPFANNIYSVELDDTLAPRFANHGASTYRTYAPSGEVETLELVSEKIPADCNIFTPMYWPGHVICRSDFFNKKIIDDPYSTWGLRLPNIAEASHRNWRAYR